MSLRYCAFFCEENAWHLCGDDRLADGERFVVIVSNPGKKVAMWRQKVAIDRESPTLWDYHVFVIVRRSGEVQVWDLDSHLDLGVEAEAYVVHTFRPVPERYEPQFRVIPADLYRDGFASDRRHMRDLAGNFLQAPPPWAVIGSGHNLDRLVDMRAESLGTVVDLSEFVQWFAPNLIPT